MIPIENSIAGRVADIHTLLPRSNLQIVGEYFLRIRFDLLGIPGAPSNRPGGAQPHPCLGPVPQAHPPVGADAGHRRRYRRLGPGSPRLERPHQGLARAADGRGACTACKSSPRTWKTIRRTPPALSSWHGRPVPSRERPPGPGDHGFVFRVRNVPSALYKALGGFATNGVNMTRLESYMVGDEFAATMFMADVEGHPEDQPLRRAFEELEFFTTEVRILGVYAADAYGSRITPRTGASVDSAGITAFDAGRPIDPDAAGKDPLDQGIEDPWYGGHSDFDAAWDQIQAAVPGIVEHVRARSSGAGQTAADSAAGTLYFMTPAPVIIAIDGRSGAGKTTLAIELAARLRNHHKVSLFHLEDIYPGWNGLAAGIERYVSTVLAPAEPRRTGHLGQLGLGKPLRRRYPGHPARRDRDRGGRGRRRRGRPAPAGRRHLGGFPGRTCAAPGRWTRDGETLRAVLGPVGRRRRTEWLAADDVPAARRRPGAQPRGRRRPRRTSCRPSPTSPRWHRPGPRNSAARRGLRLRAERMEAGPDPAAAVRVPVRQLRQCRLAGLLPRARRTAALAGQSPAAERSRFSILADDGGTFGQSVTHRSGDTRVTAGSATARVTGPFFRWLDDGLGRQAVRGPEDYPGDFTLGWLGYLGYELKRETGGSDVTARTPDAA